MMTSKSDPRGHPGLKLYVHVSVVGYYRFINFHQNRRGSGIFLGDFTWNDPYDNLQLFEPFCGCMDGKYDLDSMLLFGL